VGGAAPLFVVEEPAPPPFVAQNRGLRLVALDNTLQKQLAHIGEQRVALGLEGRQQCRLSGRGGESK
jgi:hypothetical protein